MNSKSMEQNNWEIAQIQLIKGTRGGLFLTIMQDTHPNQTWQVTTDSETEDLPLNSLIAQMGKQGWELFQFTSPYYFLKRPLPSAETSFAGILLTECNTR